MVSRERTPQDKFSLLLSFLSTSEIHLIQKPSSNFPEQIIIQLEKLILTEHHVVSREVPGITGRRKKGLRCLLDNLDF